jgi:hypothetical protein
MEKNRIEAINGDISFSENNIIFLNKLSNSWKKYFFISKTSDI